MSIFSAEFYIWAAELLKIFQQVFWNSWQKSLKVSSSSPVVVGWDILCRHRSCDIVSNTFSHSFRSSIPLLSFLSSTSAPGGGPGGPGGPPPLSTLPPKVLSPDHHLVSFQTQSFCVFCFCFSALFGFYLFGFLLQYFPFSWLRPPAKVHFLFTWDEKMILQKQYPPSLLSSFLGWNRCQESPHKFSKSGHCRILRKLHFSILKKRIFKRLVKIDFFRAITFKRIIQMTWFFGSAHKIKIYCHLIF